MMSIRTLLKTQKGINIDLASVLLAGYLEKHLGLSTCDFSPVTHQKTCIQYHANRKFIDSANIKYNFTFYRFKFNIFNLINRINNFPMF